MGRRARVLALTVLLAGGAGAGAGACGDPVVILGDPPGILRIVAGVPDSAGARVDSLATRSLLNSPRGLAVDAAGVLYVADSRTARIVVVRPSGAVEVLVNHHGCAADPCLARPDGLALDGRGGLLVADPGGHRVWRVDLGTRALAVLAGTGAPLHSPDGTRAGEASLASPTGIAVAPDGRIFLSEFSGHRVRTIEGDGRLGTLAGDGIGGAGGDGGPGARARVTNPAGLATDGLTLYIADSGNHRVRAVNLRDGTIETVAGSGTPAFGGDGGAATQAQLRMPLAVAASPDGRTLFIADTQNHRIRAVDLLAGTISTFAGTGETDYNGDLLEAGRTALHLPAGLATSGVGHLFISDTGHHLVRRTTVRF